MSNYLHPVPWAAVTMCVTARVGVALSWDDLFITIMTATTGLFVLGVMLLRWEFSSGTII